MKKLTNKEFIITYRDEFTITIKAKDKEDAIKLINNGQGSVEILSNLWEEYMNIEEEGVDFE